MTNANALALIAANPNAPTVSERRIKRLFVAGLIKISNVTSPRSDWRMAVVR